MAHITQETKKAIAGELKKVMPKGWKYSLAVRDYSTLVLTIAGAPVDLMKIIRESNPQWTTRTYAQLSNHYLAETFKSDAEISALFGRILEKLKGPGYYDRSDAMQDLSDLSHYIRVNIGTYDKPFYVAGADGKPLVSSND